MLDDAEKLSEGPTGRRLFDRADALFRAILWALIVYGFAVYLVGLLDWLQHPTADSPYLPFSNYPAYRAFALFICAPVIAILGVLLLKKQKQNIVALLLLTWVGGWGSLGISVEIEPVLYVLVSLPIGAWWMALIFLPFYFPDGKAYPRWLSVILPAIMVLALVWGATNNLGAPRVDYADMPANPIYMAGATILSEHLETIFTMLMVPLIIGVFVSPILRFRRADFEQRQQIKWFAWWSMIIFVPYLIFYMFMVLSYPTPAEAPALLVFFLSAFVGLIGLFPPVIISLAILRYRLYDIDVIIRKTFVYAVLSGVLALVYLGMVVALQALIGSLTGEESPVVIVISTLVIAALFRPLRGRVQGVIDRRFFRQKYDAEQVLARFGRTVRDEVDLEVLTAELAAVVQETMRPDNVSVWLKPAGPRKEQV